MEQRTHWASETQRFIAKAQHLRPDGSKCRGVVSVFSSINELPAPWEYRNEVLYVGECPDCGRVRRIRASTVKGRHSETVKCRPRCTSATGVDCECECSGRNHGADHGGSLVSA